MKKSHLLAGTALATLMSVPALAGPAEISFGGQVNLGLFSVDDDKETEPTIGDSAVVNYSQLNIMGGSTLDSGIKVGFEAQFYLDSHEDDDFEETFAFLEGGFGRIELGSAYSANYKMSYTAPWFVPGNGVDSPNIILNSKYDAGGVDASTTTIIRDTETSTKINYFTPSVNGLQFAFSFTPDTDSKNAGGLTVLDDERSYEDIVEVAFAYTTQISAIDLGVSAAFSQGTAGGQGEAKGQHDPNNYRVGLELSTLGVTLGGGYSRSETNSVGEVDAGTGAVTSYSQDTIETWTAGVAYEIGKFTLGVAYLESEREYQGGEKAEWSFLQLGGTYNLAQGVNLSIVVDTTEATDKAADKIDNTSAGVIIGLSF
ncbi:MAG: porin [Parvibaculales bacterium]